MHWLLLLALAADPGPVKLSVAEAGAKVAAIVRKDKPNANVPAVLPVTELTTDAVWKRLGCQVVRVNPDEIAGGEAFVLKDGRVQSIGESVGGDGVTSLAIADAGKDLPLLVYAFAWGSGIHRSQLAALDVNDSASKEIPIPPANYSFEDFTVRNAADGAVEVWAGKTRVGRIAAERKDGALRVRLIQAEDLPEALRRELR